MARRIQNTTTIAAPVAETKARARKATPKVVEQREVPTTPTWVANPTVAKFGVEAGWYAITQSTLGKQEFAPADLQKMDIAFVCLTVAHRPFVNRAEGKLASDAEAGALKRSASFVASPKGDRTREDGTEIHFPGADLGLSFHGQDGSCVHVRYLDWFKMLNKNVRINFADLIFAENAKENEFKAAPLAQGFSRIYVAGFRMARPSDWTNDRGQRMDGRRSNNTALSHLVTRFGIFAIDIPTNVLKAAATEGPGQEKAQMQLQKEVDGAVADGKARFVNIREIAKFVLKELGIDAPLVEHKSTVELGQARRGARFAQAGAEEVAF